ncbi:SGNH/GDSL hydrolase family protein [Neobacillus sp. 3P2-tot-E-2]|uniref:SGNH/GDSL hydrolase family protein n=1 Tax=Neobacillus sp. 3P2-tot-E-2 TaxID=3132212 RepID=UPI0039A234C8
MKKVFISALICVSLAVMILGDLHYKNKIKAQGQAARESFLRSQKLENEQKEKVIQLLKASKSKSVVDWLKYESTQKETLTLSVLGSSVTAGDGSSTKDRSHSWAKMLSNYLSSIDGINRVSLVNNGYSGYSTSRLLKDNKLDEVIKSKPDIVIFELCLINNHSQSVSLDQTYQDIDTIISKLKESLPDSLIVLQTANSIENDKPNYGLRLTYDDYNESVKSYVQSKGWNFISTYEEFKGVVTEKNLNYKDILSDGIHPNDQGYEIWFNNLKNDVSKTSAN